MSDFFSGVYGARFPDVVMNQGPLPGMGGLPKPLHDTVDGRINYNSSLLGDIEPYAYGEPGYLSSQNAYLNIPHRIQKIVPCLYLPEPDDDKSFALYHPIDDADIAFTMRLDRNSEICTGLKNQTITRAGLGTAVDPMINLSTLNYLLAGVQICTRIPSLRRRWDVLLHHLDRRRFTGGSSNEYDFSDIKHIVRNLIRPFGIAHGSEKQGGQHEGSMGSVQWPVNFVVSLILDGKDANMLNIWNQHDVDAGSDLVLRLKAVPLPPGGKYTLNHYPKSLTEKTFTRGLLAQLPEGYEDDLHIWQLVPDVFSFDMDWRGWGFTDFETTTYFDAVSHTGSDEAKEYVTDKLKTHFERMPAKFRPSSLDLIWQHGGYWHIARTQVHSRAYGDGSNYYNDMANKLRTGHLEVTFQPVYMAVPCRNFHLGDDNTEVVHTKGEPGKVTTVFNAIGAGVGEKRQRPLRLEEGFLPDSSFPGGGGDTLDEGDHDTLSTAGEFFLRRVRTSYPSHPFHSSGVDLASSIQESGASVGHTLGFAVDSEQPVSSSSTPAPTSTPSHVSSASAPDSVHHLSASAGAKDALHPDVSGDGAPQALSFGVNKPGLKASSARKSAVSRGKGVTSSVLAADGSVTQQRASML